MPNITNMAGFSYTWKQDNKNKTHSSGYEKIIIYIKIVTQKKIAQQKYLPLIFLEAEQALVKSK